MRCRLRSACFLRLHRGWRTRTLRGCKISGSCGALPCSGRRLGNTVLFLTVGLCLLLALALFAALVCAKGRFAPQELALLLPMVIPVNSFALGWQSLWGQNGAVNRLLGLAGREPVDFLNGAAAFPLLVALYLIKNTGCVSLILAAVIRAVPQDYQDAYQLDSTSEWGYVRRVLLPLLTPTLLIGMLLGISNYFLMFRDVYALYGSNPPHGCICCSIS